MYTHEKALELAKEEGYTLDQFNRITNPGKFSGEHVRTLYYFDLCMNGDFGDISTHLDDVCIYTVHQEEKVALGIDAEQVVLTFYDSGFVTSRVIRK